MNSRKRHARYYITSVQANPQDWQRIDAELGQIRHAWEWIFASADQKLVRDYVEAVFPYLQLRGLWREALAWAERELLATRIDQDKSAEISSLLRVGDAYDQLGHQQQLIEHYEQACALLPLLHSKQHRPQVESMIVSRLGMAYLKKGDSAKALEYYHRSLDLARQTKNWRTEFVAMMSTEKAYRRMGKPRQAQTWQRRMINLARKHRDHEYLALTLMAAGNSSFDAGNFRKAREQYQEALEHARAVGDKDLEAYFFDSLAGIAQTEGDFAKVAELHEQALSLVRSMGDKVHESDLLGALGDVFMQAGEPERAIQYFEQNLAVAREVGNRAVEGGRLASLGQAYHRLGKFEIAAQYYEEALRVNREAGERQIEARLLRMMGDLADDLCQAHEAIEFYGQALSLTQEISDERLGADIRWNLALVLDRQGNLTRTHELIKNVVSYERTVDDPDTQKHADYLAELGHRRKQRAMSR